MEVEKKGLKIFIIGLIIVIAIAIAVVTIILLSPKKDNSNSNNTNNTNKENKIDTLYTSDALNAMQEYNVYNDISKNDYSKTVEIMLESNNFKTEYLHNYYEINYVSIDDFTTIINTFLDKNYNSEEINYIISDYKENIDILLNMEYVNMLEFKDISNFDINKLERYVNYQKENDYDIKTVVTYVNIGLDQKGYSVYVSYTDEEAQDLAILVNKYHKLPDDYEPTDLVSLSYNSSYKLRKEAAEAFEKLTSAGLIDNVIFYPFSVYRSYETQNVLYSRYKARDGEAKADTYSARPGFSEHQLGLAVDVRSNTLSDNLTTKDYEWMLNNSYKYGFIVRYPKGKQHITQFMEEPWHLRYLGTDLATKVHESGLTYDEYYDLYMEN